MIANRTTPRNIVDLRENEVFVFGSNLSGIHGAGAAHTALRWGAEYGNGIGMQGMTYAIPTKDSSVRNTLSILDISMYVDDFIAFAMDHPEYTFLVTEIGCGLAGLTPEQVAPLFYVATHVQNIFLPERFWNLLQ